MIFEFGGALHARHLEVWTDTTVVHVAEESFESYLVSLPIHILKQPEKLVFGNVGLTTSKHFLLLFFLFKSFTNHFPCV